MASRWLKNLLQVFPMVSLFKLVNAAIIFAFSCSSVLHKVLLISLNCTPHIIIKWIAIWIVRGNGNTEIFLLSRLGSPSCVAWHRVLLPDMVSSSSHSLSPWQHYLLHGFDVDLHIESEVTWVYHHHCKWPSQTSWCVLDVCFSSVWI